MCVQPVSWPEPDPLITAAIAAKYTGKRPRPLAVQIRDRLGEWMGDAQFAAAFGTRGRPGWSPSRLALVTVLQRAENLTARPAAEPVRTRIDWQYLLGLGLDDPGFCHTVLPAFRALVAQAGFAPRPEGTGVVLVDGATPEQLGPLMAVNQVIVYEVTQRSQDLESLFLQLTTSMGATGEPRRGPVGPPTGVPTGVAFISKLDYDLLVCTTANIEQIVNLSCIRRGQK